MTTFSDDELRMLLDAATPGPWNNDNGYRVRRPDGAVLCETKHFDARPADARLIAMAPELASDNLRLRSLVQRLAGRLVHPAYCAATNRRYRPGPCDCGLDALMAEARETVT